MRSSRVRCWIIYHLAGDRGADTKHRIYEAEYVGEIVAQVTEKEWGEVRRLLPIDEIVKAKVVQHEHYGIVVEILDLVKHNINKLALVRVPDMSDIVTLTPEYPPLDDVIDVVIVKFFDRDYQIVLSTKASEFERVKTESKRD